MNPAIKANPSVNGQQSKGGQRLTWYPQICQLHIRCLGERLLEVPEQPLIQLRDGHLGRLRRLSFPDFALKDGRRVRRVIKQTAIDVGRMIGYPYLLSHSSPLP